MLNGLGIRNVDLVNWSTSGSGSAGSSRKLLRQKRHAHWPPKESVENPLHQGVPDGPGAGRLHRLLPHARRDRALGQHGSGRTRIRNGRAGEQKKKTKYP
jgi:hypothetical protein